MRTSTQISLKFTIFTIATILLFGLAANIFFFRNRYFSAQKQLLSPAAHAFQERMLLGRNKGKLLEKFPINSQETKKLLENRIFKNISHIENNYFMFITKKDFLLVSIVTNPIDAQKNLLEVTLYLIIFFGIISYILSLFFIKTSLRWLKKLVTFAQNINLETLDQKLNIKWPDDDEIKIVANTLNQSLTKVHNQTNALKDFIANASHELKTPLMVISSEIDYAIKSKKYEQSFPKLKNHIKHINTLTEHLLLLTKLESTGKLPKKPENLPKIIKTIYTQLSKKYKHKNISFQKNLTTTHITANTEAFTLIIQNLLENAYKYTPDSWIITISLDQNQCTISDTGIWISNSNLHKIRDKFRQEDTSKTDIKSFGLGLYLVQKLVTAHNRTINVTSTKNHGTTFTINFKN